MSLVLIPYVLKAARRDKFILSALGVILFSGVVSLVLSMAAVVEQDYFFEAFFASSIRLVGVLSLCLFVIFFIRRSFDSRDIDFLITRPSSRISILLQFAAAFSVLAVLLTVIEVFALLIVHKFQLDQSIILWGSSMVFENIIIVFVALFFSMVLKSPASAGLITLGFYILARVIGQVLGIVASSHIAVPKIAEWVMQVISVVIPRLDSVGQSGWIVYGGGFSKPIFFIFAQCAVFCIFVLIAACLDFRKQQF